MFLEPERKILLSEKIGDIDGDSELIAHSEFCFVGTMNPGGDYGKKEVYYYMPILMNNIYLNSVSVHFSYHQPFEIV